ncbi:stage III sporulation protein AG [Brevibacillus migulae]|uniref:stage III sporulation protein AG n=1 Tax=Brevibacillus migulae TaxID=1644114 RepID=UPI00106EEB1A|nr:stage III sporulation protein AG [Brevibacillus migulae]
MFSFLKKALQLDGSEKKLKPIHYVIVLLGIGIALMIVTDFLRVEPDVPIGFGDSADVTQANGGDPPAVTALGPSSQNDIIAEYENRYETQLRDILETVVGVGEVEVFVNLDSTPELVVEKNTETHSTNLQETDKEKATRNQSEQSRNEETIIISGKQEQPVVLKTLKPKVRGVVVVAKGADNSQVKLWITEAIQRALEVPMYKISVLPKKG